MSDPTSPASVPSAEVQKKDDFMKKEATSETEVATQKWSQEEIVAIRERHANEARRNKGIRGMPQGPCQCEICNPPPPDGIGWRICEKTPCAVLCGELYVADGCDGDDAIDFAEKHNQIVSALLLRIEKAVEIVRIWHGEVGWSEYQSSPEMKIINGGTP